MWDNGRDEPGIPGIAKFGLGVFVVLGVLAVLISVQRASAPDSPAPMTASASLPDMTRGMADQSGLRITCQSRLDDLVAREAMLFTSLSGLGSDGCDAAGDRDLAPAVPPSLVSLHEAHEALRRECVSILPITARLNGRTRADAAQVEATAAGGCPASVGSQPPVNTAARPVVPNREPETVGVAGSGEPEVACLFSDGGPDQLLPESLCRDRGGTVFRLPD